MIRKLSIVAAAALLGVAATVTVASALSRQRWTNAEPYGIFFNDYDPNFYTGFVPRVQDRNRVKIHLARGNQLRIRLILPDETIESFIPDQVAKHDLYEEVIDRGIIELTSNTKWEEYQQRYQAEGFPGLAAKQGSLSPSAWRDLNLKTIDRLNPERLYHIRKPVNGMLDAWMGLLAAADTSEELDLAAKLDFVNEIFPNRIFAWELSEERDAAFTELLALAKTRNAAAFRPKALAFFHDVTGNVYPVKDGAVDYWEMTVIYAAGTYDTTTRWKGKQIPQITTPGIWFFMPRMHGNGIIGMVDYISGAGYYGILPMFPYEYGGGSAYNSIHNTGISNWIAGHPLLPKEWIEL